MIFRLKKLAAKKFTILFAWQSHKAENLPNFIYIFCTFTVTFANRILRGKKVNEKEHNLYV